ncbi:MAG: sulfotransferase family protein [Chloroflexota bacterium]|nr:sulfotransferase family protein [Chloroflexota bacterium]
MKSIFQKLFKTKFAPITIVSGLPRSGTSMTMKMLDAGGIPPLTDHIRTADEDNPKGYYEFERAKKLKQGDTDWLPQAQGKAVKLIGALLVELPKGYNYRVLFMRRKIEEILASQEKMLERRGEGKKVDDEAMAALFKKHIKQVKNWMDNQPNLRYIDVDYNAAIQDPLPQAKKINQFLGGDLDEQAMAAVVDPSLYRQRKSTAD